MTSLRQLAERIASGDPRALAEWHAAFTPQMIRIVRRALRGGAGTPSFARRILAAAERIQGASPDEARQAAVLADQLCEVVLDQLRMQCGRAHPQRDTLRDAHAQSSVVDKGAVPGPET